MKYTPLGNTGIDVSVLALGAMTFGAKDAWKLGGLDQDIVNKMVSRSIDAGINFFDTADVYDEGESEKTLGKALESYRDKVVIATKVRAKTGPGINEIGLSRHHIRQGVQQSLERLGTKWIDLYQFHSWDAHVPLDESIETMQDLIEEGLVNYPGVSNFTAWQMATIQARAEERGYSRYETAQMNYSLLNRDIEHEILPFLRYSKMSLLAWSPLHGGSSAENMRTKILSLRELEPAIEGYSSHSSTRIQGLRSSSGSSRLGRNRMRLRRRWRFRGCCRRVIL